MRKRKTALTEFMGRRVKLSRDVLTVGGRAFPRGMVGTICSVHRGRFHLQFRTGHARQLGRDAFEVIKPRKRKKAAR